MPTDGEGRYRSFLADAKIVSPRKIYRLDRHGVLDITVRCTDKIFNDVCYEAGLRELIVAGYLSPLISASGAVNADFDSLHIRGGEFVANETAFQFMTVMPWLMRLATKS